MIRLRLALALVILGALVSGACGDNHANTKSQSSGAIEPSPGFVIADYGVGPRAMVVKELSQTASEGRAAAQKIRIVTEGGREVLVGGPPKETGVDARWNVRGVAATYAVIDATTDTDVTWVLYRLRLKDGKLDRITNWNRYSKQTPPLGPPILSGNELLWTMRRTDGHICIYRTDIRFIAPRPVLCDTSIEGRIPERPFLSDDSLVFVGGRPNEPYVGYVADRDGRRLTRAPDIPNLAQLSGRRGHLIAWTTEPGSDDPNHQTRVIALDGATQRELAHGVAITPPVVCGKWVLWSESLGFGGHVDARPLLGGATRRLYASPTATPTFIACTDTRWATHTDDSGKQQIHVERLPLA